MDLFQYISLTRFKIIPFIMRKNQNRGSSIILDMEDSAKDLFSLSDTKMLKKICRSGLMSLSEEKINNSNIKLFIRVNDFRSSYFKKDIAAIKAFSKKNKISGIFLPKVSNFDVIRSTFKLLNSKIKIVPIIETVSGLKNLRKIIEKNIKKNMIYGIHYGHWDYCLDKKVWPFPEPIHQEYWSNIKNIIDVIKDYNMKFINTPFPYINNDKIFWSSYKMLKELYKTNKISMCVVSQNKNFFNKPKKINSLRLKKISNDKNYLKSFSKKIINEYLDSRSNKKSFSLSSKRFIPPHQFIAAKKYYEK